MGEKDIKTEKEKDRKTERQKDRKTERQKDRKRVCLRGRLYEKEKFRKKS